MVNIFGFSSHAVSVTTTQLCSWIVKAATGNRCAGGRSCVPTELDEQNQDTLILQDLCTGTRALTYTKGFTFQKQCPFLGMLTPATNLEL